jgi:hypothetical protein
MARLASGGDSKVTHDLRRAVAFKGKLPDARKISPSCSAFFADTTKHNGPLFRRMECRYRVGNCDDDDCIY